MGMTIIEKILARKAGLDSVSRGRHRRRRRRHDRSDRPAVRHHVDPADPHPRPGQAGHRDGPRGPRADDQGRRRRRARAQVRRGLRHRTRSSTSAGTASAIRSSPRTGWPAREKCWPAPTPTPARAAPTTPRLAGSARPRSTRSCARARPGTRSRRRSATSSRASSRPASPARTSSCTSPTNTATPPTSTSSSAGRAWRRIPMHDRRTIATQGAEVSADFTHIRGGRRCSPSSSTALGISDYVAADPDSDAVYRDVRRIDLSALQPYVARPGTVSRNGLPVSELERQKVDQAFIGSCANGQLEDLEIAANVLRGNIVAPGVRLLVTPASQAVYRDAMRRGYLQDIADAGGVVTNSTCGACFGYHMGVRGAGRGVHHRRAPAISPAGWAAPKPRSSWPHRPPSQRRRSPDTSPTRGAC